jgi:hypothetical protein
MPITKKLYGLTWPTLIVGALTLLAVAFGYLWLIKVAVQSD